MLSLFAFFDKSVKTKAVGGEESSLWKIPFSLLQYSRLRYVFHLSRVQVQTKVVKQDKRLSSPVGGVKDLL